METIIGKLEPNHELESQFSESLNHEHYCMLGTSEMTPQIFFNLTGNFGQIQSSTTAFERNISKITEVCSISPLEDCLSSDSDDSSESRNLEPDELGIIKKTLKRPLKKQPEMEKKRKPLQLLKLPLKKMKGYEFSGQDVIKRLEDEEPTEFSKRTQAVLIVNYCEKDGHAFSKTLDVSMLDACRIPTHDNMMISICGFRIIDKERHFICTFLNTAINVKVIDTIRESTSNLYYCLMIDHYCRFLNLPRPSSLKWMLCSNPDKFDEYDEKTLTVRSSLSHITEFMDKLPLRDRFSGESSIFSFRFLLCERELWTWILQQFANFMNTDLIYLTPRVAIILRHLYYRKLKNLKDIL